MTLDTESGKKLLREFNFKDLFIEELGWDRYSKDFPIFVKDETFNLHATAQKRGVQIFVCEPDVNGLIPEYSKRKQIEKEITKIAHEHLIIFQNHKKSMQIWQWVSRKPGEAIAYREYRFESYQSFESLIQKLDTIAFRLDEEESLTLPLVTLRLKDSLDKDKVTKKFYDRFEKESKIFLDFIEGITQNKDKEWYSSVMLNRLMFIYFIQKKGFLNSDVDYLRNHLQLTQQEHGKNKFYSFYRYFLLRLFHEGLGKKSKTPELVKLLGKIPYLNGGLFQEHLIEKNYEDIQIPDDAFEQLFNFFDQYEWHLDDRPLKEGNEINPDVLGYIFEKFINQKEMGAYYTKEDITDYISKNTIIPFLFDSAKEDCKIAFDWHHSIWKLIQDDPDRYIYDAVKKGILSDLPKNIVLGFNNALKRDDWNKPTEENYALPTEIWRETITRRNNYSKLKEKITHGEIHSINDFITYNLNVRQFAQDVIENAEGPELVRAFYKVITTVRILDPAVGSGAFLFAALNILESLYEACLERMQIFLEESDAMSISKYSDFKQILEQVKKHPNRQYFIYKSIILKNLYGVDIMEEAIEICKLRLFLKLVSEIENLDQIEPLPDIDFNIRSGNTLVGYINREDVRDAITAERKTQRRLILEKDADTIKRIENSADDADQAFQKFKQIQIGYYIDEKSISNAKKDLDVKLKLLKDELNNYLASEYSINITNQQEYNRWFDSYKPFHWFIEFYGILKQGGFDVILGNPPYIEYSKVREKYQIRGYKTEGCGNLYAFMAERAMTLLIENGSFGFIVPISLVCTQRMGALQNILMSSSKSMWFSNFAERPSKLFVGAEVLLNIVLARIKKSDACNLFTTSFIKWSSNERDTLFDRILYCPVEQKTKDYVIPKIGSIIEGQILEKMFTHPGPLSDNLMKNSKYPIYYRIGGGRYWKIFTDFQPRFILNGEEAVSSRENYLFLNTPTLRDATISALSSSLFYWYFILTTNCRDLNMVDLFEFPLNLMKLSQERISSLVKLNTKLMCEYKEKSQMKEKTSSLTGNIVYQEFYPRFSKELINEIDQVLAKHYGFTDEELDFIINYDIKYRMGKEDA